MPKDSFWSSNEVKVLTTKYLTIESRGALLKLLPNRSWMAIKHKASRLGLSRQYPFTETITALRETMKAYRGIRRSPETEFPNPWTEEEDTLLHALYPNHPRWEVELNLPNRSWVAIESRAHNLGIHRESIYETTNLPLPTLTEAEKGYIAGMLDGEGCITANRGRKRKRDGLYGIGTITVFIANSDPKVIKWMHEKIGGKISMHVPRNPKHSISYWLSFYGKERISTILTVLEPYLIIKKAQAQLILECCCLNRDGCRYAPIEATVDVKQKLTELNRRGR